MVKRLISLRFYLRSILPTPLRTPVRLAWLDSLVFPLMKLLSELGEEQDSLKLQVSVNGQQMAFEHHLNEQFDPANKRITVITNDYPYYPLILFDRQEIQPMSVIYDRGDKRNIHILTDRPSQFSQINFTVTVPASLGLSSSERDRLEVIVARVAGVRSYQIVTT